MVQPTVRRWAIVERDTPVHLVGADGDIGRTSPATARPPPTGLGVLEGIRALGAVTLNSGVEVGDGPPVELLHPLLDLRGVGGRDDILLGPGSSINDD
jgi:hypothetical protein